MKNREVIDLTSYINRDLVWKYFNAFQKNNKSLDGIKSTLENIEKDIESQIDVKAIVLKKETKIQNGCMDVSKRTIDFQTNVCNKDVRLYIYAINMRGLPTYTDAVKASFLDLFETAYVNLSVDILREMICKDEKYVSYPLGPGLFDLEVKDFDDLFKECSLDDIGINIKDEVIYPSKACVGLYIASDEKIMLKEADCSKCVGASIGCSLCRKYLRGRNE